MTGNKLLHHTALTLLVFLLISFHVAFAAPRPGNWEGSAEFGTFGLLVNEDGTAITEIAYTFSSWSCGPVTKSGGITISGSGWAIADDQFTIANTLFSDPFNPSVKETMTINGTFDATGNHASGTWQADVRGTTCSGEWQADWSVAIENADGIPTHFALEQNYPNPFNPSTTITYALPVREFVTVTVLDTRGREIRTLVEGHKTPGPHTVVFDATGLPSGVYLYRLQAGTYTQTKKLLLIK